MTDASTELDPVAHMERMLSGPLIAQSLHVAAVLGIADQISAGQTSLDQIATATGTQKEFLDRLLMALASIGVVTKGSNADFTLTPLGETLKTESSVSLRDKAIFEASAPIWGATAGLGDRVRDGSQPFLAVHGSTFYQYLDQNAELASVFNRFMTLQSQMHNRAIVEAYDFTGFQTVVDVGGGHGATLAAIVGQNEELSGILFDLPEVVRGASFEQSGLGGRCIATGGDMLSSVPAGGDAYVIKRVMMDKTDADAVTVLRNCLEAMNEHGKILVVDPMLPEANQPHPNWFTDILMMVLTNGNCRTRDQFQAIFDTAGFELTRVIATNSPNFILEAVRK